MLCCWKAVPNERPKFKDILSTLNMFAGMFTIKANDSQWRAKSYPCQNLTAAIQTIHIIFRLNFDWINFPVDRSMCVRNANK